MNYTPLKLEAKRPADLFREACRQAAAATDPHQRQWLHELAFLILRQRQAAKGAAK